MEEKVEIPEMSNTPVNLEIKVKNYRAYRLVYFVLGAVEVILALRFLLKILAANPQNFFAMIVYGLSAILLLPFQGLFPGASVVTEETVRRFEASTIIAMIVYGLLALGIAKLILIFKSKPSSTK